MYDTRGGGGGGGSHDQQGLVSIDLRAPLEHFVSTNYVACEFHLN